MPPDILKQDSAHVQPFLIYPTHIIIQKLNLGKHMEEAERLQQ